MLKLWRVIPLRWMTKPCDGTCGVGEFHTHDTTLWFRLAYGSPRAHAR
jgi:hypothetical protein